LFARLGDARFVQFCSLMSTIVCGFLSVLLSELTVDLLCATPVP